jgi:hypothetical protein
VSTNSEIDTLYHFKGPAEEVYATLVVRLVHAGVFNLVEAWRAGAEFRDPVGNLCEVSIESSQTDRHELAISFEPAVVIAWRLLLSRFVHDHLQRRAIPDSVQRERIFRCKACGEAIRNARAVAIRRQQNKTTIVCQFCENDVPIFDDVEQRFADRDVLRQTRTLEDAGDDARDAAVGLTTATAKALVEEYDVFLAYHTPDEAIVEEIAVGLRRRGLNPWFAKWCIPPGRRFRLEIEHVLVSVNAVAVFLGPDGIGPWEDLEVEGALQMFVRRRAHLIPVGLPGRLPNADLPLFLRGFAPVSFADDRDRETSLDQLEWGITGRRPTRTKRKRR